MPGAKKAGLRRKKTTGKTAVATLQKAECCPMMQLMVDMPKCPEHDSFSCPDRVIQKRIIAGDPTSYRMPIKDGGCGFYKIAYCPFCGAKLP
jgi:hypothetical protein